MWSDIPWKYEKESTEDLSTVIVFSDSQTLSTPISNLSLKPSSEKSRCMIMKGIAACYSKHSVQISDSCCSGSCKSKPSCSTSISKNYMPSVQNSVTCLYQSRIPDVDDEEEEDDDDMISTSVTWTSNLIGKGFSIHIMTSSTSCSDQFRKCKGSKTIAIQSGSRYDIKWDLTNAEYDNGPEPTSNFFITVCKNTKPVLTLGDHEKHKMSTPINATFSLVSRTEYFSGTSLTCTTKAQFCDTGKQHEILIKYVIEEDGETKEPILIVSVDKKKVLIVKRLQWNFRGNQCVFVDGIVVDLMWDVHEWLYNPVSGNGLFLFKTRNGVGSSRLWLVEEDDNRFKEKMEHEFSLLVISCKKTS